MRLKLSVSNVKRIFSMGESSVFFSFLIMCILLTILSPYFLTVNNLLNIIRQISVIGIIASGMTFTIIVGGIDLSVGSMMAFTGCLMALLMQKGINPWLAVIVGLAAGATMGAISGILISRIKMPPFVATLGMMSFLRGMALTITNGWPIGLYDISKKYKLLFSLGNGKIGIVPIQAICMVIVLIILHFLLSRMSFGYKVYAVGGNERAAFISGINVKNTKLIVFCLSGFLCAIAAVLSVTYISAIEPMIGIGYELDAISAAVIGGTDLSGGSGTILGTFLGACIMGVLYNGLVLLGVSPFMTQTIIGLVVIVAVTIGLIFKKRR